MIVYDVEIQRAIPDKRTARIPGIQYCAGWEDYEHMGISVIAAYDLKTETMHVFCEDNLQDFAALIEGRTVVGFNSVKFDDCLCRANGIQISTAYDILREVYIAVGLDPFPEFFSSAYKGYGLDALASATLNLRKSGHGELAPVLWQQGKIGKVINYCLFDIRLTVGLFRRILSGMGLTNPHTGERIFPRNPIQR